MTEINNFLVAGQLPAVITPRHEVQYDHFIHELRENSNQLQQLLLKHGALLFRGFPLAKTAHFTEVIESLALGTFVNYIGGDSPRDKIEKGVYTSTEAPPTFHIPLHQELSFIKKFPRHIYFYCETAAEEGGETVIGDARAIYAALKPELKQRFQAKGITYTSNYYYQSKIMTWLNHLARSHKSWTEVFESSNKKEVEKKCIENEFAWRWHRHDWLEIKQNRPAIFAHPQTNEKVWFNQAHLYDFNPRLLGWLKFLGVKLFYLRKSTRLHEVRFADGSRIPRKDLYHIMDVLKENTVAYPWKKGDVMVLDNILTMHGRAPFKGKRRVLAAMTS